MSKKKPDVCYRIMASYSDGVPFYLVEAFDARRTAEAFVRLKREQMLKPWQHPPKMTIVKFVEET